LTRTFLQKVKATSISNETHKTWATVISLQLSLKNEREEGRVLNEDLVVEWIKKRELEAELIESREKVKASEQDNQKLQVRLSEAYEDKQQLATNNPKLSKVGSFTNGVFRVFKRSQQL